MEDLENKCEFLIYSQTYIPDKTEKIMTAVLINPKDKQKYIFLPSYT